ncbi:MAG: dTDP-4-dehydrorhamnose 3,5-epimerase [Pseudomonadales bacterium]
MNVTPTSLPGVVLIEPRVFGDERGFFLETYQQRRYEDALGRRLDFVQDNHSRSGRGVLRGLHFQIAHPQAKLVRVVRGEVFDVAADVNPESETFGRWVGFHLSESNHQQLFVPEGYAHGFQVLSDTADFEYKCVGYYRPEDEGGVVWNDPDLAIDWPLADPIVSDKDQRLPTLGSLRVAT